MGFCEEFGIDERGKKRLNDCMTQRRRDTWNEDLARLWEDAEEAKGNPTRLVMKKVTDMYNGTFVGYVACKDKDVLKLSKKYKIDKRATRTLAEAMERLKSEEAKSKALLEIDKHLETSNKPSQCCMRLLSFVMTGQPLPPPPKPREDNGNGDAESKGKGKSKGRDRDTKPRSRSRHR